DMFSQTRTGALDFMSTSGVNQTVVPVGGINAVAFAFENYDKVWAAMDGDLGDYVRAQFDKVGMHVIPKMLDNGYRNITTGEKQINTPDDLKGLKIRVPGNQLWVTLFSALGAAPTSINFGELYAALQTHVVDGEENPLALISSAKLYEVQKYIALTGHIWDGHYIFANQKKWAGLPDQVRYAIMAVFSMGFGLFTPPFGVGFYLACAICRVSPDVAIRSVWPHLAALFVVLIIITLIPWISTGFL